MSEPEGPELYRSKSAGDISKYKKRQHHVPKKPADMEK